MALEISPEQTRIGWIGTGVMGRWMCGHLIGKGYTATVYTRTRRKLQPLVEARRDAGPTRPKEVAEQSDVVICDRRLPAGRPRGDSSATTAPGRQQGRQRAGRHDDERTVAGAEIAEAAKAKGVSSIDAPVSGGDVGAKNAALSIMIGGDADRRRRGAADLEGDGQDDRPPRRPRRRPAHEDGEPDPHRHEDDRRLRGLLYGYKAGLDLETVLKSVSVGRRGQQVAVELGPRMMARNFEPGFFVEHFIKDMGIALAEAGGWGWPARAGAGEAAIRGNRGPGPWPNGHPFAAVGFGANVER